MKECVNIHGVGSLVESDGVVRMVAGYRLIDESGVIGVGYLLVPYPFGYIDSESIAMAPHSQIGRVYFDGHSDQAAQEFVTSLADIVNAHESSTQLDEYHRFIKDSLGMKKGGE